MMFNKRRSPQTGIRPATRILGSLPLLCLLLIPFLPPVVGNAKAQSGSTDQEYDVCSVVLDSLQRRVVTDHYLVGDTTLGEIRLGDTDLFTREMRDMPGLPAELIDAYAARNRGSQQLVADRFHARFPVLLTNGAASSDSAIVATFSRVGFSTDGTQALVHMLIQCGDRCGYGLIVRLALMEGRWVIQETKPTVQL